MKNLEIVLKIQDFTPDTLPMARLAEYLAQFSALLGSEASVHFSKVAAGSLECHAYAEVHAIPIVHDRIRSLSRSDATGEVMKAFKKIDDLLAQDNTVGHILFGGEKIIEFPGRLRTRVEEVGPVFRATAIQGQIFQMGGKDKSINIRLRDGRLEHKCETSVPLARSLAPYFLNGMVRLSGNGEWVRKAGRWELVRLWAESFEVLQPTGFQETLDEIRGVLANVPREGLLSDLEEIRG